jgi:TP901 family phage tail tape measure protein
VAISDTISINAGSAIDELNAFADAAARAEAAYAKIGKGGIGAGADALAASMSRAAASIDTAVGKINASLDKVGGAAEAAAAGLERVDEAAATTGSSLADAAAGADEAAAANDRLAAAADAAGAAMDRQVIAGRAGAETAAAGAVSHGRMKETLLATGLVLGYSVDKAMKFNAQMTLLMTQAGVSARQMPQLTKGVLELAGQVGQSPGNLAESLYHVESNMSSLGIKAPQALHMVKVAAEGASVGHANLVDTTNALTAAVAAGIPGVKSYDQAMGVLNATVGSGDMSMQDLADAMGTGVLAVIKGYGANIKDAGAALATFGDNNIRGAKAGTDLRMAVQALAVPAASAKDKLKDLGLTTTSLADTMQNHGMLAALEQLDKHLKQHGVTAKNEGQTLTDLFGKKAGVGLAILMEQLDRVKSKYPELTEGANKFGQAWSKTLDTPQQKLKNLEQGAQALAITAGNVLMPAASAILGGLGGAFRFIQGDAFASKGLAIGAGGLVAGGLAKGLFRGVESGVSGLGRIGQLLRIPGADKLAGVGGTGAAALNGSAARLDGAAASLEGAAASLKEGGIAGGLGGKGKAGAAAAEAEGAAAGGGLLAGFKSAIGKGLGAGLVAAIAIPLDTELNKAIRQHLGKTNPGAANVAQAASTMGTGALIGGKLAGPLGAAVGAEAGAIASLATMKVRQSLATITGGSGTGRQGGPGAMAFAMQSHAPRPVTVTAPAALPSQSFTNMLATAMHKPVKLPPPDMSALTAAKGKAQAAGLGIARAIEQALHKPVKAKAPDLSAYQAAAGKAQADGTHISAGLAAGIEAGKGAAVAAANDVASAVAAVMASALQTRSPSKKTEKIGKDAAAGLVLGLQGGKGAVDAAATAMGKQVAKAADIQSIDATTKKLLADVPKKDTGLTRMLKEDQGRLTSLANQRAKLEQEITNAQDIAKQAISSANITGAADYTPVLAASSGPLAASATISGMKNMAADQAQFARTVAQLKKEGLNATSLTQIVQAGPSALPMAQGLAQGGKSAIQQVNQLESQIHASAAKLGNTAAGPMYQAGVAAGQGLAQGIKSQLGAVEAAMKQLADAMVAAVKKALKSHSPSLIMADVGMGIPQGLGMGVDRGAPAAVGAMNRMGSRLAAWRPPAGYGHPAAGGYHGGGTTHIAVTNYISGHVMTEHDLVSVVQNGLLTRGNQNWQAGVVLPGRAA